MFYGMMTLKELVAKVGAAATDRSVIDRRIRHWSAHGILRTARGVVFTGQGRARSYDDEAMYVAAVLNELSKYGMPLMALKAVADELYKLPGRDTEPAMVEAWQRVKVLSAPAVLCLAMREPDADGTLRLALSVDDASQGSIDVFFPAEEGNSVVVVKLLELFRPLLA